MEVRTTVPESEAVRELERRQEELNHELERRRNEMEPLVTEHERIGAALRVLRGETPIPGIPRARFTPSGAPSTTSSGRRTPRRMTPEEVRDAALAAGDFNLKELSARLDTSNRGRVGQLVAEMVERGTLERYGASRGPTTRWRVARPARPEVRTEREEDEEREPGWKAQTRTAVPHTGTVGPAQTPGKLRRQQEKGHIVRR